MLEHCLFRSENVVKPLFSENMAARLKHEAISFYLIDDLHRITIDQDE